MSASQRMKDHPSSIPVVPRDLTERLEAAADLRRSIGQYSDRLANILREVESSPMRQLAEIAANEAAAQRAVLEAIMKPSGVHRAFAQLERDLAQDSARISSLVDDLVKGTRFTLPDIAATARISEIAAQVEFSPALSQFRASADEMRRSIEVMQAPWLDVLHTTRSITGFAELGALGRMLAEAKPFGAEAVEAARTTLGDWRGFAPPQVELGVDAEVRLGWYRDYGLDSRLTAFSTESYLAVLDATAVRHAPPLLIDEYAPRDLPTPEAPAEDEALALSSEAYAILRPFESQVRALIAERMEAAFGQKWKTQRVPGPVVQQWRAKRAAAVANGERPQPLLAYADFTDYIRIIERMDNWTELFRTIFSDLMDTQVSFRRLHVVRIPLMHARPITTEDILLAQVETRRILRAFEHG